MTISDKAVNSVEPEPMDTDPAVSICEPEGGDPGLVAYQDGSGTLWGFTPEQARALAQDLFEAAAIVEGLNTGVLRFTDQGE